MLEALFGADMPLAVRFLLAFLIVLGLIGATATSKTTDTLPAGNTWV
jgi:hypothetical protein